MNANASYLALVVDDVPMSRQLVAFAMGRISNLRVHEADTVEQGVEALMALRPDIVFAKATLGLVDRLRASSEFAVQEEQDAPSMQGARGVRLRGVYTVRRHDGSVPGARVLEYEGRAPSQALRSLGDRIWTVEGDRVRFMTMPFSTRMTVIQLTSGQLWLHSPVSPASERVVAVAALGPIGYLVAPNRVHSLGVLPWKGQHPQSEVWVSPRFAGRHPNIPVDGVLGDEAPAAWAREIDQLVFGSSPFFDEVVFFHRPSRTLILTDLIQRHPPEFESWFWRLAKASVGVLGDRGGTARDLRWAYRDRAAARRSAQQILHWDFDQVVISHGKCIHEDAKAVVSRAFSAWLG